MILGEHLSVREMTTVEANSAYLGVSTLQLMENAGKAVADAVKGRFENDRSVVVVCGTSGNGGDGFVAARHLASSGYPVEVILLGSPEQIRLAHTRVNWDTIQEMRSTVRITRVKDSAEIKPIKADVVVDALIGTSMRGVLKPPFREMVEAVNRSDAFKVAVDVPTGMVADTGEAHGEVVRADLTVTFHKPKKGYANNPELAGELLVAPIGIPPEAELYAGPGDVMLVHPRREPGAHKGMYGSLLVIGGSETYSGAPALAAMGAYATGLDLVYVAVPETAASIVAGFSPSLITVKLKGERLRPKNLKQVEPFLGKVDAVALGPGLGLHDETVEAVEALHGMIEERRRPLVVDADGLKAYAQLKPRVEVPAVFTPHSREFELLTGKSADGGFREKGAIVQRQAKKLGAVILLKGSVDVISDGGVTRYNWTGNPGMTVGGTGDVLTGVTAGFMAMGATPFQSAVAGAFVNGAAGDRVYEEKGYHLLPEDLIEKIPLVIEDALRVL
jgi:NAD(P)H-hydrate epimerase